MEQVAKTSRWSLNDLLPEPVEQGLEEIFSKLEQALVEFEATRTSLTNEISWQDFNPILSKLEAVTLLKSRLEAYADLSFAEDTQNPTALNLRDRVDQILTDAGNRALFFEMWFKELPDETIRNLTEHSGNKRYFLETMTRFKPFTLTELEERMINLKDVNGIDALVNLYEMITNQFKFSLEIDGQTETLTRDQLSSYFSSSSPELRAKAYQELYRVYTENSTVLAQMYFHRVRDWHTEGLELRGFAAPISARNVENDLPDEVVATLLDVCRNNSSIFQRYFKMKAQWLSLEKLRRYDIYAPLTSSETKFDYAVAKQMVMDSCHTFSPEVAGL
ncbi:MAG TPA: oligoendopeptidase F, partial [Anaerolineales bacterium]|nr:oligoendopeptidase F [Anaerolineales bacterium]